MAPVRGGLADRLSSAIDPRERLLLFDIRGRFSHVAEIGDDRAVMTSQRTPQTIDADLAILVERDYVAYAASLDTARGITTIRRPDLLARRGEVANEFLNVVLGTWTDTSSVDELIRHATGLIGGPGRSFTWAVWPSSTPADLGSRLEAAGFEHGETDRAPLMVADLDETTLDEELPPAFTVERATDAPMMAEAAPVTMAMVGDPAAQAVFSEAYRILAFGPDPTLTYFVGRFEGQPVATSALCTGTGLAGIVGVGTVPGMRGRGFGRAVTVAALAEGRRRGLRLGALMSSELGLPVYRRIGFREVGWVDFYASPRTDDRSIEST